MNKGNKLLLGMLTFVVVCVVGYALFNENINVTGSVTASGDWSITASCSDTIPAEVLSDYGKSGGKQGGYEKDSCLVSGNKVTTSTTLLYPTAKKIYQVEYKNTGSVNAVFKMGPDATTVLQDASMQPGALDLKLSLYNKKTNELYKTYTGLDVFEEPGYNYGYVYVDKVYIKSTSGTYLNTKTEILGNKSLYKDADGNYYLQIKPGESIAFLVSANWDEDAVQTDYYSVMELKLDMKLIQQTDDLIELESLDSSFDICINYC